MHSRFFASLFARLTLLFANAANGIVSIISDTLTAREKWCVGSTCVDEDQFKAAFENVAAGASSSGVAPEAPAALPANSGPTAGEEIIVPNNDQIATTTPPAANDNAPVVDDEAEPEPDAVTDQETAAAEPPAPAPELEASNDNQPIEELPATE